MFTTYRVREPAPAEIRTALTQHSELLQDLLFARGITDAQLAREFLNPHFERHSHDPFLLPDMAAAVERIMSAIKNNELIAVWSDYDCDGVPGGVALTEFLRDVGARVRHYIPDRHLDGFGLNNEGLQELAAEHAKVVITVDCGTTDIEQAIYAKEKGIDLVITDHHLPVMGAIDGPMVLPDALVVNPHRTDSQYPFRELCGAGVAWKLIQAILDNARAKGRPFEYAQGKEKWLLDLVGLATLSDMVPLVGENRMLASYGLLVMRKNRRPGLRALLRLLKINAATLVEDDLTFMISPRINAASRMERAQTAAELLAEQDAATAAVLALNLNRINDERKGLVAATVKEARKRIAARDPEKKEKVVVVGSLDWRPGILGLVAQKLAEEEHKPAFVWGRGGSDTIKGSCRSDGVINIVGLMAGAKEIFEDYGGHDFSGGFSLREERVHELAAKLLSSYETLNHSLAAQKIVELDRELEVSDAGRALRDVQKLSPFGVSNAKPLFLFPNVSITKTRTFGKANDHLEITLDRNNSQICGVSFFSTPESFQKKIHDGAHADIVAHLELDFRNRPRLRVVDVI